jgi:hypothetical protein
LRMQRISPHEPLFYRDPATKKEWVIPAGKSVSMDPLSISMNPKIFPEPEGSGQNVGLKIAGSKSTFSLSPKERESVQGRFTVIASLLRAQLTKTSINLAYAELYIILAGIFRKYDMYEGSGEQKTPTLALYETNRERDVDMAFDLIVPFPSRESKGVRAIVR